MLIARRTSPLASGRVLPSSRVMSAATESRRQSKISAALKRMAPRAGAFRFAQAGKALAAAAAASAISPADPFANRPTISSVLAGLRFSKCEPLSAHWPSMYLGKTGVSIMSASRLDCGRLEVGVDLAEARYRSHDVVRKQVDARIVMFHRFVVLAAGHRNPIFGAFQRLQQIAGFLAAFELGIKLHQQHQARQSVIQPRIGLDLFLLAMRDAQQLARIVDRQDRAAFGGRFGLN